MSAPADRDASDLRCHCGNLLARVVANGIELKCRRCRRSAVVEIPTDKPAGTTTRVRLVLTSGNS